MEITREMVIEAGLGVVGVGLFMALVVAAGSMSGGNGLNETGAMLLVGAMVVFVVGMAAMGYWLSSRD
ncbi:hypothetical protein ACFQH6_01355 [Halobacteriaceae archaeon GCM10025711]